MYETLVSMTPSKERQDTLRKRELDLDVVRGVAILLAMGLHFNEVTGIAVVDMLLAPGRHIGWAGVDLFFVLSGFLVGTLVLREVQQRGCFDAKSFLGRRAFRLWPVLYVYLLAQVLVGEHSWHSFLWQNLLHIQNYAGTPLAQMWSLAVEEHFYLSLALLLPLWARRSRNPKTLLRFLVGLLVVPAALRASAVALGADPITVQSQTHFRVDSLAAGLVLAVLWVHYPQYFEALLSWRPIWILVTIAGCVFLWHVSKSEAMGQIVGYSVAWITSSAFLLVLRQAPLITRVRPLWSVLAALGTNAYALYIWHASCAGLVEKVLGHSDRVMAPLVLVVIKYGFSILVAIAVSKAVERPGLALRDRFFPRTVSAVPVQDEQPSVLDLSAPRQSSDRATT